jgi:uncharacterized protein
MPPSLPAPPRPRDAYHVMTKPIGPLCNLDCKYCFYLEKEEMYPKNENFKMSDATLESYIRQYIASQNVPEINFAWQGGEPTLMGLDFFRKVVDLQARYADGKKIANALQTNGTLLDDEWCEFFRKHGFLIGLSIDGPRELHDVYRVDKKQRPTFDAVVRGIDFLKKHTVEFNTLTVVNRANSMKPLEVYRFLKEIGSGFMQFIPLVERAPDELAKKSGLWLATPPPPGEEPPRSPVTDWSVQSKQYGTFLVDIFNEWVRQDVGRYFVQIFDVTLGNWMGQGSGLCVFAERCGGALALEHNGDLFSCDHYVYPHYKLGNILNQSLGELVNSAAQFKFGNDKSDTLPEYCRKCDVRFLCNGECPKHRFIDTPAGEPGLNYLCSGYKKFFTHAAPFMETMAHLIRRRQPPAAIMEMLAQKEKQEKWANVDRNSPCPCGSGKKYKKCCGVQAAS